MNFVVCRAQDVSKSTLHLVHSQHKITIFKWKLTLYHWKDFLDFLRSFFWNPYVDLLCFFQLIHCHSYLFGNWRFFFLFTVSKMVRVWSGVCYFSFQFQEKKARKMVIGGAPTPEKSSVTCFRFEDEQVTFSPPNRVFNMFFRSKFSLCGKSTFSFDVWIFGKLIPSANFFCNRRQFPSS